MALLGLVGPVGVDGLPFGHFLDGRGILIKEGELFSLVDCIISNVLLAASPILSLYLSRLLSVLLAWCLAIPKLKCPVSSSIPNSTITPYDSSSSSLPTMFRRFSMKALNELLESLSTEDISSGREVGWVSCCC